MILDPSIPCVAADLEGTLTTGQTWKGIRAYLESNGRRREYGMFFAARLPSAILARTGLLDKREFENRYTADTLRFFRGLTPKEFRTVAEFIVEHELWPKRRETVLGELEALRLQGRRLILASGTYQPVLEAFAWRLEAEAIGTQLEVAAGKLTGRLSTPVNVGQYKVETLRAHLAGATLERAYGDTLPDAPMLEAARVAVAVNPDLKLGRLAQANDWRVLRV
jgi:phosphoserine phosphatase